MALKRRYGKSENKTLVWPEISHICTETIKISWYHDVQQEILSPAILLLYCVSDLNDDLLPKFNLMPKRGRTNVQQPYTLI